MITETESKGNGSVGTAVATVGPTEGGAISAFASEGNFVAAQRMAKGLMASSLAPEAYRLNLSNVLIAMELASRIGCSVLMVMQNLAVIKGKPSWSSSFLIASVNASGRFTPLRFRWEGEPGTDTWGCRAFARDRANDEECVGSLITLRMVKAEGWYSKKDKNGQETSKWQTMPEQMFMYRSAAFWTRVYCPEIAMGIRPVDELEDMGYATPAPSSAASELEAALRAAAGGEIPVVTGTPIVGEEIVEEDETPPSAQQLKDLKALLERARSAQAVDFALDAQVADALKAKDGRSVREASRDLNRALLTKAGGGQPDLGMEG